MTFRGNLLLYSLWYELHPFENLRRKASLPRPDAPVWAERKIFTGFWVKILWAVHLPGQSVRQVVAVYAPATGTHTGVWHRQAMSRDPPQRREARLRNGVAPYIPASFCRDAGAQATARQARPERSLQTGVLRQGWKPAGAETAPLAPFTTARPPGTPGKA